MSFEIHKEPLYRRYYASPFSGACLYAITFIVAILLLPLIISYNSNYFWIQKASFYDQIYATYKYKAILNFKGFSYASGSKMPLEITYTTSPSTNQMLLPNLRTVIIQNAELDDNNDGRIDRFEYNIKVPYSASEEISEMNILFNYDVRIDSYNVKYSFDAVSIVSYSEPSGRISNVWIEGNLNMQQTWPLTTLGGYHTFDYPDLVNFNTPQSPNDLSIPDIALASYSRNLSLSFESNLQYSSNTELCSRQDKSIQFTNITIIQRVPQQIFWYTPPVSYVLKEAWIQYLSFFILIAFLFMRLNSFVFRHQLLFTQVAVDVVTEKNKN